MGANWQNFNIFGILYENQATYRKIETQTDLVILAILHPRFITVMIVFLWFNLLRSVSEVYALHNKISHTQLLSSCSASYYALYRALAILIGYLKKLKLNSLSVCGMSY